MQVWKKRRQDSFNVKAGDRNRFFTAPTECAEGELLRFELLDIYLVFFYLVLNAG